MAAPHVIRIPDRLGGNPQMAEPVISALYTHPWRNGTHAALDLSAVGFVRPYGAVQLLAACEMIAATTGNEVELRNIRTPVHAYLRRLDFFTSAPSAVLTRDRFEPADELLRSPASTNVLELQPVTSDADVSAALLTAKRILEFWLSHSLKDRGSVIDLIAEACTNIVEHSDGRGWVVAQKYERQSIAVELAIADGGIGIQGSLSRAYGRVASSDSEYITLAMRGRSSKGAHKSVGLPTMRITTEASGGYLFIRSGCGQVWARNGRLDKRDGLALLPGTQLAMSFESTT